MSIFVLGINYKTASVSLREKVYFALDKLGLYLQDLLTEDLCQEAVLLSTCNRSELYCDGADISALRDWFCVQTSLPRKEIESALYIYQDEEALEHIMQVACGIDSMILGEPQILGQMKEAFSESCSAGAVGPLFHRLFQQVFAMAKDVRTATAIGACPVSVASAAVHFAKQKLNQFSDARVTLVGAGDTGRLLLRYLTNIINSPITIVNRSIEKAEALTQEFNIHILPMERLEYALAESDIIFTATGSARPIITKEMLLKSLRKPITLVDIAVPRDIEEGVNTVEGVSHYCIDDLKEIIEKNRQGREHAANKARDMIQIKRKEFFAELKNIDRVSYTIRAYRSQIEALCSDELRKAKQDLKQGINPEEVLDNFARAFTKKLMHAPSTQLRKAGAEGKCDLLKFAKQLFCLPDPETERL